MPALAGTSTCQLHHVGFAVSGLLHVRTDAGDELEVQPQSLYVIPPGHDAWVVGDEPFVTIDWGSARTWATMLEGVGDGEVVTLLFTDIVDSTATLHRIGDEAWRERLRMHHVRMRDHLNAYRGRQVKTTGDGLLAVFDRPDPRGALRRGDGRGIERDGAADPRRHPHGRGRVRGRGRARARGAHGGPGDGARWTR